MPSVMVSQAPLVTALMTRSLVSRMATAGLTGTDQATIADRTCPHACAAAAWPSASRTRRCRSSAGSTGVAGAIVSIAGPLPDVGEPLARLPAPGEGAEQGAESLFSTVAPVARQILVKIAMRDIGQLTDLQLRQSGAVSDESRAKSRVKYTALPAEVR